MEPAVKFTPKSGQGIHRCRRSWYVAPSPLLIQMKFSSNITVEIAPGWQVMVLDSQHFPSGLP